MRAPQAGEQAVRSASSTRFLPLALVLAASTLLASCVSSEPTETATPVRVYATQFTAEASVTSVTAGTSFLLTVTARDSRGGLNEGYRGTVFFTSTDPIATLPADYTFTEADQGRHLFAVTLHRAGTQRVTVTDSADFFTASATVQTRAGAAVKLAFGGLSGSIRVDTDTTISVTAQDAFGNTDTAYTGTVHFTPSIAAPATTIAPNDHAFTLADRGVHSFTLNADQVFDADGNRLTLAVADQAEPTIQGTKEVVVLPGTATTLRVRSADSPINSDSATLEDCSTLPQAVITAEDDYGNVATNYRGTATLATTIADPNVAYDPMPPTVSFTAGDQGKITLTNAVAFNKGALANNDIIATGGAGDGITAQIPLSVTLTPLAPADLHPKEIAPPNPSYAGNVGTDVPIGLTVTDQCGDPWDGEFRWMREGADANCTVNCTTDPASLHTITLPAFPTSFTVTAAPTDTTLNPGSVSFTVHGTMPLWNWSKDGLDAAAPTKRAGQVTVWNKTKMYVWGGYDINGSDVTYLATGAAYDALANSWSALSDDNAPAPRTQHAAAPFGDGFIIFGGSQSGDLFADAHTYDYRAGEGWQPVTQNGMAPDPRVNPSVTQAANPIGTDTTNEKLIVWGGSDGIRELDTGYIYDPLADNGNGAWSQIPQNLSFTPAGRQDHSAVWDTYTKRLIIWGGRSGSRYLDDGAIFDPAGNGGTGSWTVMASLPRARAMHGTAWDAETGKLYIWGGWDGTDYLNSGAVYTLRGPQQDTWDELADPADQAPDIEVPGRAYPQMVWSGAGLMIFGGYRDKELDDVVIYNPAPSACPDCYWGLVSSGALADHPTPRVHASVAWSPGDSDQPPKLIVWGGGTDSATYGRQTFADGAVLNTGSKQDVWTYPAAADAPLARTNHTAVWTGRQMLVWGGNDGNTDHKDGAAYDPVTDSWSPMAAVPASLAGRRHHTAVWTGEEMYVWGGYSDDGVTQTVYNDGARYNPTTNTWTMIDPHPTTPAAARQRHTAVWTGSEMVIWGGSDVANVPMRKTAKFSPATGWKVRDEGEPTTDDADEPLAREDHVAVWMTWGLGIAQIRKMFVWGGRTQVGAPDTYYANGAIFDPSKAWDQAWEALAPPLVPTDEPEPRRNPGAVFIPETSGHAAAVFVWGGRDDATIFENGSIYDPGAGGTWTPLPAAPAASGRVGHSTVFTGSSVIIWGGETQGPPVAAATNTGLIYALNGNDLTTGTWHIVDHDVTGNLPPAARTKHTAVWTGDRMLIWGGQDLGGNALGDGGIYRRFQHSLW